VDLSDALLYTLTELKKQRKEEWLAKGNNEIPPWVFCNLEGNPLDPFNLKYRHFLKCLKQCGLRPICFHDLLLRMNLEPKTSSRPVTYLTQIHLTFTTQIRTLSAPWPQMTLLTALTDLPQPIDK